MGRLAAILSLCLWISIIVMGRVIGFTITRTAADPPPANVDFQALMGGNGASPSPAAPAPAPAPIQAPKP
jgi:hypothetical protein